MLNTVIELNGKYSDWLGCHAHHFSQSLYWKSLVK